MGTVSTPIAASPTSTSCSRPPSLSAKSSDDAVATLASQLVPSWSATSLNPSSLAVRVISGGITNALWSVSIKDDDENPSTASVVPRAVAVRAYGDRTDLLIDREREVETLRRLNERGFGAEVVASFGTGRVEELLPGRALTPEETAERDVAGRIARGLARLHAVGVVGVEGRGGKSGKRSCLPWPLRRLRPKRRYEESDSELFPTIREWISLADDLEAKAEGNERGGKKAPSVDSGSLRAEVALLERRVSAACSSSSSSTSTSCPELSRVVFCHMDLLPGNIMTTRTESEGKSSGDRDCKGKGKGRVDVAAAADAADVKAPDDGKRGPGEDLQFIDFEYGRPCQAGFDVGNHWCEYAGLDCDWNKYPSAGQRADFARAYLGEARDESPTPPSDDDVAAFVELGELFSLAAHLFWTSWAKVQVHVSPIDFDYGGYAASRFAEYLERKGNVKLMGG